MNPNDIAPQTPPPAPQSPQSPVAPTNQPQPQLLGYDSEGRPLYGIPKSPPQAPPTPQPNDDQMPNIVHVSRAPAPVAQEVPAEVKARHEDSVRKHPDLNLSEAEYIISTVRRHPIGLILPILVGIFLITAILAGAISYPLLVAGAGTENIPGYGLVLAIAGLLSLLVAIGVYIVVWVYRANQFYLTNESVIQEIQTSLFSKHEQTVSLGNIEDASFVQSNIIQSMFDYGSIRLSTEGDETTYRFSYVTNPKRQIAILNNAVESFKNGRPVLDEHDN